MSGPTNYGAGGYTKTDASQNQWGGMGTAGGNAFGGSAYQPPQPMQTPMGGYQRGGAALTTPFGDRGGMSQGTAPQYDHGYNPGQRGAPIWAGGPQPPIIPPENGGRGVAPGAGGPTPPPIVPPNGGGRGYPPPVTPFDSYFGQNPQRWQGGPSGISQGLLY